MCIFAKTIAAANSSSIQQLLLMLLLLFMLLHGSPEIGNIKRSQGGCGSGSKSALIQEIFNIAVKGRMANGALATRPYIYLYIFLLFSTGLCKHVRLDKGDSYNFAHDFERTE